MKKTTSFLFWICILSACVGKQEVEIPRIDQSLIKIDDLIWDLEFLQEIPEFSYWDSTSRVRELVFKGVDDKGADSKVFAYYSNPDILKTGKDQGNKFPGVVLISGGDQPAMSEWVERQTV